MAFNRLILTTSGRVLAAKGQQGKQLHFTRIALGDGILGGGSMVNRRNLISEKLSMKIDGRQLTQESTVSAVIATLSNKDLTEGFVARELALMARDPDTHEESVYLYAYAGEDHAEYIPDKDSGIRVFERIKLLITLQDTPNVTFDASGNPLYMTYEDFQTLLDGFKKDVLRSFFAIGNTEPSQGPILWFDTRQREPPVEVVFELGEAGEDGDVQAEIENINYPVKNAVLSEDESTYYINIT